MQSQLLLLLALAAFARSSKRLPKEKVVYAVSCGSSKGFKSSDGYFYEAVASQGHSQHARL